MMKEWSAARERVQEVKAKNAEEGEKMSKEITSVSSSCVILTSVRDIVGRAIGRVCVCLCVWTTAFELNVISLTFESDLQRVTLNQPAVKDL